jgi:Na+/phosphate symporter
MIIPFKRHLAHWSAIIAVLMSSVAPTVSQAVSLAQHGQGISIEVCSTTGVKMTQVIDASVASVVSDADELAQASGHCPLCVVHGSYVLPLNHELSFAKPVNSNIYPQLFYQSPKPLFAWVALPSRAPPALV